MNEKLDTSGLYDRIVMLSKISYGSVNKMLKSCNLPKSTVDNIKNGSKPSIDRIKTIANALAVSTDYLLTGENPDGGIPIKVDSESINIQSIVDNAIKKYESEKEKLPQAPELLEQLTAVCADMSEDNQLKLIEIAKILKSQQVRKE